MSYHNQQTEVTMTKFLRLLFLPILVVLAGCNELVNITGPDGENAVPVGAVFSVRNNEAQTASPGFGRIRVNGQLVVSRIEFGQVAQIDLTKVNFYDGKITFSAEGYAAGGSAGLVYLGCQAKTLRLSQIQNGVEPWAFNDLRLRSDC